MAASRSRLFVRLRHCGGPAPREEEVRVWDDEISELGVCVYPNGVRSFILRRHPHGKVCWGALGSAERMRLIEDRREAPRTLAALPDTPEERSGPLYPGAR